MSDLPTQNDLFRIGRDEVMARSNALTKAVVERPGTDANALVAAGSAVGDEVIGQLAGIQAGLFQDTAKGKKLDRLLIDRYGLYRKPAAPAFGEIVFTTTAANPIAFSIPRNTRVQTGDGNQFVTLVTTPFPALSVGPISIPVRSVLAGSQQQAKIGTITTIIDKPTNAPTDLVITNPLATFGADDEELDEDYRLRAQEFYVTARRGTLRAITAGALAVPGVRRALAFEYTDALGRPAKGVSLVISDAFTAQLVGVTPTPTAYQTQSAVIAQQVADGLEDVRAAGILVTVLVAEVVLQGVSLGLSFIAGADADAAALQARGTVAAYINGLAPGASFVPATAINKLRSVPGLTVTGNEILSPSGTVVAQPLQVLRSSLSLVVAVTQGTV
jgi:uncharacterized phage protein gp47/JayE